MTCRRKHRKCDEKQPLCSQCQTRGLECVYQTTLKWASVDNISSFDKSLRKRKRASKRASSAQSECTPHPRSPRPSSSGATSAGIDFQGHGAEQELVHGDIDSQCDLNGTEPVRFFMSNCNSSVNLPSLEALHHISAERDTASIQWHDAMFMAGPVNAGGSTETQLDDESLIHDGTTSHTSLKFLVPNDECVSAAVLGSDYVPIQQDNLPGESPMDEDSLLDEEEIDDIEDTVSRQEIESPTGYKSWVVDNTLNSLLFQIFQSPGEEIAFAYCKWWQLFKGFHLAPGRKTRLILYCRPQTCLHMHTCFRRNPKLLQEASLSGHLISCSFTRDSLGIDRPHVQLWPQQR